MKTAEKKTSHPNRIPFNGVLCRTNEPSSKPPGGSRGHSVILTREAAEEALDSLIHMGIDFKTGWDGHDARQKCGVITKAWMEGDDVHVSGFAYCRDFPELAKFMSKLDAEMGMSYELADAHVENMRSSVWRINHCTFTGAAILLKSKAAYGNRTSFNITASAERFTGKLSFIDHQVKTGRARPVVGRNRMTLELHTKTGPQSIVD